MQFDMLLKIYRFRLYRDQETFGYLEYLVKSKKLACKLAVDYIVSQDKYFLDGPVLVGYYPTDHVFSPIPSFRYISCQKEN